MILSEITKKELRIDEIVDHRISLSDVRIIAEHKNNPYEWLDKHVEVWYNVHYTRPSRIVREVARTICDIINIVYDTPEQRQAAKSYAERQLTKMILGRTKLEDHLQRVENDRAMTTNPKRLKELNKTYKALKAARAKELVRLGFSSQADKIRYGG